MKAMILCAGLGTRLRPLTERWPKPAIPLLGKPLLRYALAVLKRGGVSTVGINTHHLPDEMERVAAAECERARLPLQISREPVIQGTGGGIRGLRSFLDGDAFVVFNGDILFALDLAPIVAAHRESNAAATMVLLPMPKDEPYAAVELDGERRIRRIAGRGPGGQGLSSWHFSGVHVMSPAVFDFMAKEGPEDINREVYVRMIDQGLAVRGHVVDAFWSDVGTPSRYLAAQRELLFERVPLAAFEGASPLEGAVRSSGRVWAEPGAEVAGAVAGPAYFSRGSRVAPGAQIGSAVYVGPDASVADRARLNRAAVLEGTQVDVGEELVETIAWERYRIPAPLPLEP